MDLYRIEAQSQIAAGKFSIQSVKVRSMIVEYHVVHILKNIR
jgi:hypothetical protein